MSDVSANALGLALVAVALIWAVSKELDRRAGTRSQAHHEALERERDQKFGYRGGPVA
jgi:hypothetical protein